MAAPSLVPRVNLDMPLVRIELRHRGARPIVHEIAGEEFLIGSVPGCDLRIPGANLPPIVAQIIRRHDGVRIRKLAPAQPILLNGQPLAAQATLAHGDVLHIGTVELHVHLSLASSSAAPAAPAVTFVPFPGVEDRPAPMSWGPNENPKPRPPMESPLEAQRRQLEEQAKELNADRVLWYRRREEIEREWREHQERMALARGQLQEIEQRLAARRAELQHAEQELARLHADREAREEHLERERREVEKLRGELMFLRQELASRAEADTTGIAARERALQERERQLQARIDQFHAQKQKSPPRLRDLPTRDTPAFQADLIPLEARAANNVHELSERYEQMQRDAHQIEEQARQLDGNADRLRTEAQRLERQKREQDAAAAQLAERTAQIETQQALIATLRTRLEKLRDDVRRQSQELAAERTRQEEIAAQLQERLVAAESLQASLQADHASREQERAGFEERSAALHSAVAHLRQLKEHLEQEEQQLRQRIANVEQHEAQQAEKAGLLTERAKQLLDLQQRTEADRQSLKERETTLLQADEARRALAEQLRRRVEELTARGKALDEQSQTIVLRASELQAAREQVEAERQQNANQLASMQHDLAAKTAEIERLNAIVEQREENLRRHIERLKEAGQTVATDRQALLDGRAQWEAEQQAKLDEAVRARGELETFREQILLQAAEMLRQAPEAELHSQGALDQLAQAREQLRSHLAELHAYVRQSHEDLQNLRSQVQHEAERLHQQELAIQRARSEHRLALTAFRQQLIEWQGRVGDLQHFFAQNESRIELKQQALESAAKEVDAGSQELARQSEALEEREREVSERKHDVERHLNELREWYRAKLRDLAGNRPARNYSGEVLEMPAANGVNDPQHFDDAEEKNILSLTGDVDPADKQLGELLQSLGLVDADMLMPLWTESRRQRRSLRQVLLSSGTITLYQMALIEAGNIAALALGPYRVIDRVQATPREILYRVFDPGRSSLALLRHLSEQEMHDAVHPDEYRQRFAAAMSIVHPNIAATFDVTEIHGRPAVLQEWVSGLPSSDWPALAAVPGVWYRLLGQSALALQALHGAGLVHGRLEPQHFVLSAEATIKLTGVGEPAWLSGAESVNEPRADLAALGLIAAEWSMLVPRRKSSKPRPLPPALQDLVRRLGAAMFAGELDGDQPVLIDPYPEDERYSSAAELLEAMEQAGADLPANSEAWDRLVKHVSDHIVEGAALRRTA